MFRFCPSVALLDPAEIVRRSVVRSRSSQWLQEMAPERAATLLSRSNPVYFILDREHLLLIEFLPVELRARARTLATIDMDQTPAMMTGSC